ncbi:hypothetical protein G6F37_003333 [Rhizopus arrhizus]|nr:hypothetical protein G6F38_001701 [Rhizopus arrhizus]KAG1161142.1 hypothetical protein G6F37_003333 [Rhizopus arrhizus]
MCKISAKNNVRLHIYQSSQKPLFDNRVKKYNKKYEPHSLARGIVETTRPAKGKRSEPKIELIEASKKRIKRQTLFMEQSLHLARENAPSSAQLINHIEDTFKRLLPSNHNHRHVSSFDTSLSTELIGLDNTILTDIDIFINCIIKFEQYSILVTSFGRFAHCQPLSIDCAHIIYTSDVSTIPIAKIQKKNTLNKVFKELSIFIGLYMLLIVGGCAFKDNMTTPLLGSSLRSLDLPDSNSSNITVSISRSQVIKTVRLLNQYFKRCSFNLWGYCSMFSFSGGFIPIMPADYLKRCSQENRNTSMHHLASKMLFLISCGRLVDQESLQQIWSLDTRLLIY